MAKGKLLCLTNKSDAREILESYLADADGMDGFIIAGLDKEGNSFVGMNDISIYKVTYLAQMVQTWVNNKMQEDLEDEE